MTIRLTIDHWPDGDRAQTKRLGVVTVELAGGTCKRVLLQDHTGRRLEVEVDGVEFDSWDPWAFAREVLRKVEEERGG